MGKCCSKCDNLFYPAGKNKGKICEVCKDKGFTLRIARERTEVGVGRIVAKKINQEGPELSGGTSKHGDEL